MGKYKIGHYLKDNNGIGLIYKIVNYDSRERFYTVTNLKGELFPYVKEDYIENNTKPLPLYKAINKG